MPARESLFSNWGQLLANSLVGSVRVCLHKPWGLDESGLQLAGVERNGIGSDLSVCACLCPGGFGCGAKDGQIQVIVRLRQGRGWLGRGGKSCLPSHSTWEMWDPAFARASVSSFSLGLWADEPRDG